MGRGHMSSVRMGHTGGGSGPLRIQAFLWRGGKTSSKIISSNHFFNASSI